MFDFLHRWRSVSPQTHFSAPPAFAPSLGANLTIGEIHFWPRTTQTATSRPQAQCPRETLKESGRKRSGRSLRFARATSPRVPSITPSRARAGPGGGRKEAAERNKKAAAVGQKAPAPHRPAPPRATGLRLLRRAGPARAALKRESKKRRSGAAAKRTRAAPTLRPESRGARPSKFGRLASPARLQIQPSANDKVCRSSRRTLENRPNRPQRAAMLSRARGQGAPEQTTAVLTGSLAPDPREPPIGGKSKAPTACRSALNALGA